MPLSEKDRQRFEDDILFDRRIVKSLYCSNCGYNLKTLPRSYTCPECGQPYNARRQPMYGIYLPHTIDPPFPQLVVAVVTGIIAVTLLMNAFKPFDHGRFYVGLVFATITLYLAGQAFTRFRKLIKFQDLARRIAQQQEDED